MVCVCVCVCVCAHMCMYVGVCVYMCVGMEFVFAVWGRGVPGTGVCTCAVCDDVHCVHVRM